MVCIHKRGRVLCFGIEMHTSGWLCYVMVSFGRSINTYLLYNTTVIGRGFQFVKQMSLLDANEGMNKKRGKWHRDFPGGYPDVVALVWSHHVGVGSGGPTHRLEFRDAPKITAIGAPGGVRLIERYSATYNTSSHVPKHIKPLHPIWWNFLRVRAGPQFGPKYKVAVSWIIIAGPSISRVKLICLTTVWTQLVFPLNSASEWQEEPTSKDRLQHRYERLAATNQLFLNQGKRMCSLAHHCCRLLLPSKLKNG